MCIMIRSANLIRQCAIGARSNKDATEPPGWKLSLSQTARFDFHQSRAASQNGTQRSSAIIFLSASASDILCMSKLQVGFEGCPNILTRTKDRRECGGIGSPTG